MIRAPAPVHPTATSPSPLPAGQPACSCGRFAPASSRTRAAPSTCRPATGLTDGWRRQLRIGLAAVCTSAVVLPAVPARAEKTLAVLTPSALKRMSVEELMVQQVVSVSRKPESLGQAPSSVFAMSGEAARVSGASRLPQLLRLAPNLFVAQSSASEWAVSARGFTRTNAASNKLLVLIDGRTVYSPLFSGVFWDSQDVFVPDLERVEAISGPAGVTWGANAVNGVINILTKSARDTQGGVLYAGAGTTELHDFGARYGGEIGASGAYRVYAKRTSFDSTLAADGSEDDADAWQFAQTGFRTDWGTPGDNELTVQGDAYSGRYNHPGTARARNEGANLLARWSRQFTPGSALSVRAYHDYTLRETPGDISDRIRTSDLDFQHRWEVGRHDFVWGGNYRFISDDLRMLNDVFAILPARKDLHLAGGFVQDEVELADGALRLTAGLRMEHNAYTGWEHQPSARLAWSLHPQHMVWFSASRATRTPSRIDSDFYFPASPPFIVAGGPHLESEVLHAVELGWRGLVREGVSVTFTAYRHDYHQLRSVEISELPLVIGNGVEGRSRGVELFVDWDVTDWWRLRAGGFLLDQDTWIAPGHTDGDQARGETSDPDYQILLRSTFSLTKSIDLWIGARHVAELPAFENGVSGLLPAYTELDARLGWTAAPGVELSITGRNLLHPSHPEIGLDQSRREIPRSVHAQVRWDF